MHSSVCVQSGVWRAGVPALKSPSPFGDGGWVEEQQTWGSAMWGHTGGSASDQEGLPQQVDELVLELDLEKMTPALIQKLEE